MSAIPSPLEPATRSAMLRTFCSSKAIFSITCAGIALLNLSPTKKWACAHWCASTIPKNYDTTVFIANYTPASAKRQTGAAYGTVRRLTQSGLSTVATREHAARSSPHFFAACDIRDCNARSLSEHSGYAGFSRNLAKGLFLAE